MEFAAQFRLNNKVGVSTCRFKPVGRSGGRWPAGPGCCTLALRHYKPAHENATPTPCALLSCMNAASPAHSRYAARARQHNRIVHALSLTGTHCDDLTAGGLELRAAVVLLRQCIIQPGQPLVKLLGPVLDNIGGGHQQGTTRPDSIRSATGQTVCWWVSEVHMHACNAEALAWTQRPQCKCSCRMHFGQGS